MDHLSEEPRQPETDQATLWAMFDSSPEFVGLVSLAGVLLRANRTALEFIGRSEVDVIGREFWTTPWWVHSPELQDSLREAIERAASGEGARIEVTHRDVDGELHEVDFSLAPMFGDDGRVTFITAYGRDITERKRVERALREAERRLAAIIEFLPDATFVIDSERKVIAWNRALEEMTGVRKEDMLGRGDFAYGAPFYGEPSPILVDLVWQDDLDTSSRYDFVERRGDTLLAEVWVPSLYGGRGAFVMVAASPLRDESGVIRGAIESVRDVTERKQAQESLRHAYDGLESQVAQRTAELEVANEALTRMTLVDGLTGIANRRWFDDVLEREWRRAARNGVALGLIMLDIDFFKSYNDAYGHLAGDDCLRRVAGALAAAVRRPGDLAARYGGEEFAVVLPQTDAVGALAVAEELRERIEALGIVHVPSSVSDHVTVSLGVASVVPDGDDRWLGIIAAADRALYRAKHEGRNRVCGEPAPGV